MPSEVWLSCGLLDMCVVDFVWMDSWGYLCNLCHHQVIFKVSGPASDVTVFSLGFIIIMFFSFFIFVFCG
ncbi:hypothetical protein L1987_68300 [Smallanthus sonchifolius]|uniref:Uncharacterized protein n=1 Tax=Smallanthus sonchifolius TaxID=185202 RepID=A0ACB9B462_9ASTR|nr:hypothetical protein L1987_68300 [Smallanthus sonchifolius]